MNLLINSLSFSTSQGLMMGFSKEAVSEMGMSYYIRLFDSLSMNSSFEYRKKRITDIVEAYLLVSSGHEGSA